MKDLHGQDDPGVLQVGDVQVASCVAGQADVQHSKEGKRRNMRLVAINYQLSPELLFLCFSDVW